MKPIIKVEGLSKRYSIGKRQAVASSLREAFVSRLHSTVNRLRLRRSSTETSLLALVDICFEVYPGEVVGIIGRNGAGKSTLLKILSRITRPTSGQADLYGRVGSILEVGTGFHPDLTGRENIYLNGAILGMKRREIARKFDEIVDFSEVEKFLDTPVKRYSSGMYLRLAFAVAAHLETEILMLDEVLSVGDTAFQKKCLGKMRKVSREGRTVLFVSHNMASIQQFCERALLIGAGALQEQGSPEKVIGLYLNEASDVENGDFDLSKHTARSAHHHPVLKRLVLYSRNGSKTMRFHPGDTMIAEIFINTDIPLREPRITLAIQDSAGRRITTVASYFQSEPLGDIESACRIRCLMPELKLGSGRYLISVRIHNKYAGLLDALDNAARFEITWHNSYGNGEPYHASYGPMLTSSSWERVG
jgi:lipopolysaccharide transport system ATP-binding protein